jgi:hypothetical protein
MPRITLVQSLRRRSVRRTQNKRRKRRAADDYWIPNYKISAMLKTG